MEDIILQYTYPRLDAEVSKHRNHLLKAPFCVHPKTGRVCVPVNPKRIDDFDPEKVPTVGQLLRELDSIVNEDQAKEHHSGMFMIRIMKTDIMYSHVVIRLGKDILKAVC